MPKPAAARNLLPALLIIGVLFSCRRIRHTVEDTVSKTKDAILPGFDGHKPDTRANKRRFRDFLKVPLTPDIRNIYCYGDALGIDAKYQFAFNCDTATASRIITTHHMLPDTSLGFNCNLPHECAWWKTTDLARLHPFIMNQEQRYFQYFWYDTASQRGYYFDFDM